MSRDDHIPSSDTHLSGFMRDSTVSVIPNSNLRECIGRDTPIERACLAYSADWANYAPTTREPGLVMRRLSPPRHMLINCHIWVNLSLLHSQVDPRRAS